MGTGARATDIGYYFASSPCDGSNTRKFPRALGVHDRSLLTSRIQYFRGGEAE